MRGQLVQAIVRGERPIWALLAVAWILALVVVLKRRREPVVSHLRVFGLLTLATALSLLSTTAAEALSIPRIVWKPAPDETLVADSGETWRRLRGPTALVAAAGAPDLAVPTIDSAGRWVLSGIVSGRVLDAPPATPGTPEAGTARLCSAVQDERCRPWPADWPTPTATFGSAEFVWAKDAQLGALAYDVESGLYLRDVTVGEGPPIELIGRIANDAPHEGTTALFVVRRVAGSRLEAARVVAISGEPPHYRLERAHVSLLAAPSAFHWIARPMLMAGSVALPLVVLAYLLAPLWLGARLRSRAAVRRELERALVLVPIDATDGGSSRLATVADDADLGDAFLSRGTTVVAALPAPAGMPVASRVWFELPAANDAGPGGTRGAPSIAHGIATMHAERGSSRPVGVLVPADAAVFRRTARALLCPHAHALAIFAIGVAVAAPALVAVVALLGAR